MSCRHGTLTMQGGRDGGTASTGHTGYPLGRRVQTAPFDTNVCVKNSERCESISGWGTVSDYPEHGTEQYKESLRFDYTFWEVDKIYMKLELLIEPCMDWIKTGDRGMFTTNQPIVSFFFLLILIMY